MGATLKIWDTYISPASNALLDLGSDALEFKDLWIDGTAYLDAVAMHGILDMGDHDITSIDKLEGVDVNTFIDLGSSDLIDTKGNIIPNANAADDLGSDAKEFNNLWIDGKAYIDGLGRNMLVDIDIEIEFGDNAVHISSQDDGHLDLTADTSIDFNIGATEQFELVDGAIQPTTDNDVDLGASGAEFKDLFIDGTANIDSLVADTADINAGTWQGTIDGNWTALGQTCADLGTVSAATAVNLSSATLEIPNTAGDVSLSNAGEIAVDSTQKQLVVHDGVEKAIPLVHTLQAHLDLENMHAISTDWRLLELKADVFPDGIVILNWHVDCAVAGPATELTGDLMRCNALGDGIFPHATNTVIDILDTTTGNSVETDNSNMDSNGVVATGQIIYLHMDATAPTDTWLITIHFYIPES